MSVLLHTPIPHWHASHLISQFIVNGRLYLMSNIFSCTLRLLFPGPSYPRKCRRSIQNRPFVVYEIPLEQYFLDISSEW